MGWRGWKPASAISFLMDATSSSTAKSVRDIGEGPRNPDHVVMASAKSDKTPSDRHIKCNCSTYCCIVIKDARSLALIRSIASCRYRWQRI